MLKTFKDSICAGVCIAIGGSVFLACDNKVVGAILFSVALLCICFKGYYLFTGKIGYIVEDHSKNNILALTIGLFGNLLVTFLLGMLIKVAIPNLGTVATALCEKKLEQTFWQTFVRACFCGVLMYLAVSIYKEKTSPLGILFCIPVFILSGFEHSIADMFYFGASGIFSWNGVLFIVMVVLGNAVGSAILPLLTINFKEKIKQ